MTRIRALDLDPDGIGGLASIVSSGVGYTSVTVRLQSLTVGGGYHFYVDIYGN